MTDSKALAISKDEFLAWLNHPVTKALLVVVAAEVARHLVLKHAEKLFPEVEIAK